MIEKTNNDFKFTIVIYSCIIWIIVKFSWTSIGIYSSKCTLKPPPDAELKSILDKAGIDGIEYKNAVPDFSPVSKLELDGIDMTNGRTGVNGTYSQANNKFAQMLNDSLI